MKKSLLKILFQFNRFLKISFTRRILLKYSAYKEEKMSEQIDLDKKWRLSAIMDLKEEQKRNLEKNINQMTCPNIIMLPKDLKCRKYFDKDCKLSDIGGWANQTDISYASLQNNYFLLNKIEQMQLSMNELGKEIEILKEENCKYKQKEKLYDYCCSNIVLQDKEPCQKHYWDSVGSDHGEFKMAYQLGLQNIKKHLRNEDVLRNPKIAREMFSFGYKVPKDVLINQMEQSIN